VVEHSAARRPAATLLLQQAVPARVAMQILGHSQIQLTLGTYSHVVPELAQEAADRMGAVLWNCRALSGTSWHTRQASEAAGETENRRPDGLPRLDLNQEPCD
jgi:hypothetical protein